MAKDVIKRIREGGEESSKGNRQERTRSLFKKKFPGFNIGGEPQQESNKRSELQKVLSDLPENAGINKINRALWDFFDPQPEPPPPRPAPQRQPQPVANRTRASNLVRRRARDTILTDRQRGKEFLGIRTLLGSSDE